MDANPAFLLAGLADSWTHGTMGDTNSAINTLHAYLQTIAESLVQVTALRSSQPLFDVQETRLQPFRVPTNLGIDGADVFSLDGISYDKRAGAAIAFITDAYLCDKRLPGHLDDEYDKVLYPISWHRNLGAAMENDGETLIIFWVGNDDSSTAALGSGGENPTFIPIPLEQIEPEGIPSLRLVLRVAQQQGALAFAAYTMAPTLQDFVAQYDHLLSRLDADGRLTT
jgi:hypothetical protein